MTDGDLVSSTTPDWSREKPRRFWDPSRRLLRAHRRYNALGERNSFFVKILKKRWILSHRLWSIVTGADVPLTAKIGGGLLLPHPNGVVIHDRCEIGPNCMLFQQVTIGASHHSPNPPTLKGHVDIGAGAKIIGDILIEDHSLVGANAVVTKSTAQGDIVAGIPAKKVGNILERAGGQGKP